MGHLCFGLTQSFYWLLIVCVIMTNAQKKGPATSSTTPSPNDLTPEPPSAESVAIAALQKTVSSLSASIDKLMSMQIRMIENKVAFLLDSALFRSNAKGVPFKKTPPLPSMAMLYDEFDSATAMYTFNLEAKKEPSCLTLSSASVDALDTLGSCIAMYVQKNCTGLSKTFVTMNGRERVGEEMDNVNQSVGPCPLALDQAGHQGKRKKPIEANRRGGYGRSQRNYNHYY